MSVENIKPIDSFNGVFKILLAAGFYIKEEPKNRVKKIGYEVYRAAVLLFIILHNVIHIIFIAQNLHDTDAIFDTLIIEIPQINLLIKSVTFYVQNSKIRKLNELLMDPIFAANSNKDAELLLESKKTTDRLWKYIMINVLTTSPMWVAIMFIKRYYDPTAIVYIYTPFEVNSWGSYTLSVVMEAGPLFWMGCGHLALDVTVVLYLSQVEVQLKIIKSNLERLFDADSTTDEIVEGGHHRYNDEFERDVTKRFVHYVKRYENVLWLTREVLSIFNVPTSGLILTSMLITCATTYLLSMTNILSLKGLFLLLFLVIVLVQVFMCCYFGNLVQFESQSVSTALYLSDWQSASPRLRRALLVAMLCWSRPITPTVAGIIPLSLDTFVTFLKSAYTLFAVNASIVGSVK